jgi:hypothetical protein
MFTSKHPILQPLFTEIGHLSFSAKKALITLARSQQVPDPDYDFVLYEKVRPFYSEALGTKKTQGLLSLQSVEAIHELIRSPATTGFIISLALSAKIPKEEVIARQLESSVKEFVATQGVRRDSAFDWGVLFDRIRVQEPLSRNSHPRPDFNGRICDIFHGVKRRMQGRRIFPHFTNKGVSRETQHDAERLGIESKEGEILRNEDIVRHYIRTGVMCGGRVGMKQRFYPTQLTPRTYFSTGGEILYHSMYLREIFNELQDVFDPTNRFLRVALSRLECPRDGFFFVYDLTSFSSNFSEQIYFLDELARFFEGVSVLLIGPNLYAETVDLGSLLHSYVEHCNNFPEFTIETTTLPLSTSIASFVHSVAGFLGVYGNLATCTLPHGLALSQHAQTVFQVSCAGDDAAIGVEDDDHMSEVIRAVEALGILQTEKCYTSKEAAVYLKRPFVQEDDRGLVGSMVIWPLASMVSWDLIKDNRYPMLELWTRDQVRNNNAAALFNFRRSFAPHSLEVSAFGIEVAYYYMTWIHNAAGLPKGGFIPQCATTSTNSLTSAVCILGPEEDDIRLLDPVEELLSTCYPGWVEIPSIGDEVFRPRSTLQEGFSFTSCSSNLWRFLDKMGYVYREEEPRILLVGEDGRRALSKLFVTRLRKQYKYTVLEDLEEGQLISLGVLHKPFDEDNLRAFRGRLITGTYVDLDRPTTRSLKRLHYEDGGSSSEDVSDTELWEERREQVNIRMTALARTIRDLID